MTIRDNFSSIKPTLFLDFMKSKKLDPRITFGRSDSTQCATYTDAAGIIRTVPANTPRFNHRYDTASSSYVSAGLLLEEGRTNLITQSENFANSFWAPQNSTLTPNTTIAPDGNQTAYTFTQTSTTTGYLPTSAAITFTTGRIYTFSCYVKKIDIAEMYILFYGTNFNSGGAHCTALFNLDTLTSSVAGGAVTNHDIVDVGNGWRRISASFTATTTTAASNQYLRFKDPNATKSIYIWGAQLEESTSAAFATSYVKTAGSTVARASETTNILTLSPWYNVNEGTLYAEFDSVDFGANRFPRVASLVDSGGQTNVFQMLLAASPQNAYSSAWDNGSPLAATTQVSYADKTKCRSIFTYDSTTFRGTVDGATAGGGTLTTNPSAEFNRLSIGHLTSGAQLNGHVHQIIYYPKKFSDALMERMTK